MRGRMSEVRGRRRQKDEHRIRQSSLAEMLNGCLLRVASFDLNP